MLGDRIKTLRTARNLSQVELARKLNVSKQSVSNWENNNILPSVDIVKKLALFFFLFYRLPAGNGTGPHHGGIYRSDAGAESSHSADYQ